MYDDMQSVRYSHIEIICVTNLYNARPVHDILGISVHLLQYTHTKLCFLYNVERIIFTQDRLYKEF